MARAFPIRTAVFTLVPLFFALSQLAIAYAQGGSLLFAAAFSAAVLAYAVLVHQYHLAAYKRTRLSSFSSGHGQQAD